VIAPRTSVLAAERRIAGPADWLDAAARERGWRDMLRWAGLPVT